MNDQEKIGPVAILETKDGLRVAVYLWREYLNVQYTNGRTVKRLAKAEFKTDGGQSVIPEHCGNIATIYGGREPIQCSVVRGSIRPDGFDSMVMSSSAD
jgi:hypothetical protein